MIVSIRGQSHFLHATMMDVYLYERGLLIETRRSRLACDVDLLVPICRELVAGVVKASLVETTVNHSCRRASFGSSPAARWAGMMPNMNDLLAHLI